MPVEYRGTERAAEAREERLVSPKPQQKKDVNNSAGQVKSVNTAARLPMKP